MGWKSGKETGKSSRVAWLKCMMCLSDNVIMATITLCNTYVLIIIFDFPGVPAVCVSTRFPDVWRQCQPLRGTDAGMWECKIWKSLREQKAPPSHDSSGHCVPALSVPRVKALFSMPGLAYLSLSVTPEQSWHASKT